MYIPSKTVESALPEPHKQGGGSRFTVNDENKGPVKDGVLVTGETVAVKRRHVLSQKGCCAVRVSCHVLGWMQQ